MQKYRWTLIASKASENPIYSGIKIFNNLPSDLESVTNGGAWFKLALNTRFTLSKNGYCLENDSPI
jgi:hypothetical protein